MSNISAIARRRDRRCISLLYHHVGPARPGSYPGLTVAPSDFERQIQWLVRWGYVGIRPGDWFQWLQVGRALPKKPILITFDDAYADIAEYALPVLRRYGFGGAVFVVTARTGKTNTWDECQQYATLPLMSADQIRFWAEHEIEFGSHSRTHQNLTMLCSDSLFDEAVASRDELAVILGSPVKSFAYPFGACNDLVLEAVKSGYDLAFSCIEGFNRIRTDPHLLRRVSVAPNCSMLTFSLMVYLGGMRKIQDQINRLALRTRLKRMLGIKSPRR